MGVGACLEDCGVSAHLESTESMTSLCLIIDFFLCLQGLVSAHKKAVTCVVVVAVTTACTLMVFNTCTCTFNPQIVRELIVMNHFD